MNYCQPCGFHHPGSYDCEASRRRERLSQMLLDIERNAYAAGYEDRSRERDRVWAAQPPLKVCIVPSHAELEEKRWGPGGRKSHFLENSPNVRGRHLQVVR